MSALSISESAVDDIRAHAVAAYPCECCGAMLGWLQDSRKSVERAVRLVNAEPNSPERRFVVDPRQLLEVERAASLAGFSIVGYYHSHPDAPSRPSSTDLEWAWPVYSYVIVSVVAGTIADVRSFAIDENASESRFIEEETEIS